MASCTSKSSVLNTTMIRQMLAQNGPVLSVFRAGTSQKAPKSSPFSTKPKTPRQKCQGASKQYYVFVVPIAEEVQLKQAAKVAGEKSVELIPVKEITKITGYVRGGCSPMGMKKLFPTFIHNSAENFDKIYVSGGRIGTTICLDPKELAEVTRAQFADIIVHES